MEVSQTGVWETEGEDFRWSASTKSMHSKRSMEVSQTGVWETGGEALRWSASTKLACMWHGRCMALNCNGSRA